MAWYRQVYDWLEQRLQLEGPIKAEVTHPVPRKTASWWYVFGSASFVLLILQVATGILLGLGLFALGGACMGLASGAESRSAAGLVSARHARLGIEFHGRRGADPHGAGFPLWCV